MDKGVTAMIGESVLVYQAVEHLMKRIAQVSDISAPLSRFKASCEKRGKHVVSSTMGGVVEDFLQILEPLSLDEDESFTEPCLRVKLEIVTDADKRRTWSERTRALVADRNWLIHQSSFDLESKDVASRQKAVGRVEACYEEATRFCRDLSSLAMMVEDMKKRLAGELGLSLVRVHSLMLKVLGLSRNVQVVKPDKDGWVPMQRLMALCRREFGQEYDEVRRLVQALGELGFLKTLMGGVEISERPTKKGARLMYRIKA